MNTVKSEMKINMKNYYLQIDLNSTRRSLNIFSKVILFWFQNKISLHLDYKLPFFF